MAPFHSLHPSACLLRRSLLAALAGVGLQACGSVPPAPAMPLRGQGLPTGPTVADRGSPHYRFARFGLDSADGQRRYRVQLAIPKAPPPAAGSALLVLLDGQAAFAALTDEMLAQRAASGRPLAIAAVGYETSDRDVDMRARSFDYTPPVPGEDPTWDDAARQRRGGGADLFLDLLAQQILPAIAQHVPTDPARSTLWGHSYGGLLTLYALFTRPQLFARYAAADPSLWWHDGFVLSVEPAAQPLPADRSTSLLLMTGGGSAPTPGASLPPTPRPGGERRRAVLQDATPQLAQRLAERAGMAVAYTAFPGLGHGAMRPASLPPTLEFAAQ